MVGVTDRPPHHPGMDRRRFLLTSLAGALAAPLAGEAQQVGKVRRIGILIGSSASFIAPYIETFRQALRGLGYLEGQNIAIEYRYAEGNYERLPVLAAELVRLKVDIIVTEGTPPSRAAKQATTTIPIIMTVTGDPVATGLVANLARPGGNLTGASFFFPEIAAKRQELLKEAVPAVSRVTLIWNPANPGAELAVKAIEAAAKKLGIAVQHVKVQAPADLGGALSAISKSRESLLILEDALINPYSSQIASLATRTCLPTIFGLTTFAEAGGLMAYGPNRGEMWRRAATFVDKILRGARPGELPVEQSTRFDLVINLKTAKTLGLTIPPSLLARADQVIDP
jgi:putative ABC transport system substrate-binding protein